MFLAEHYYWQYRLDMYNKNYQAALNSFEEFKNSLSGHEYGLIDRVNQVLDSLKINNNFSDNVEVAKLLDTKIGMFRKMKTELQQSAKILQLYFPQPEQIRAKLDFSASRNITLPIGLWKEGNTVQYAVQLLYKDGGITKISVWSRPYRLKTGQAFPVVKLPNIQTDAVRLVFRKFLEEPKMPAELVGVVDELGQNEFRDINKDVYNIAAETNEEQALKDLQVLLDNGAKVGTQRSINGKDALHVAAENDNFRIAKMLIEQNVTEMNVVDENGKIHIPK